MNDYEKLRQAIDDLVNAVVELFGIDKLVDKLTDTIDKITGNGGNDG